MEWVGGKVPSIFNDACLCHCTLGGEELLSAGVRSLNGIFPRVGACACAPARIGLAPPSINSVE